MTIEYIKFFINGGILGLLAWGIQLWLFTILDGDSGYVYAIASAVTYLPLIVINFIIQKKLIFKRQGIFWRFVVSNLSIMIFVSLLSPVCRDVLDVIIGPDWGKYGGFALAALIGSIPSFLIKKFWAFNKVGEKT
ncbi:GtrA family protein [Rhizobium sp. RU36D]|uniref:GtrA family protein n=1 Tax=Rhizobium sp. RU36D TaxID=1907415 RepID=UPI0009D7BEC1|nr:GtrA family protein [Rhizobium sp. RU36D]SMC49426.1 GtrA-like protein [Rhizobium sp. RU36D]